MRTPEKILIIRLSSLGDILHAMPALYSLRSAFPDARIDWLVEKKNSYLPSAFRGIDDVLVLDTSPLRKTPWKLSAWKPACDLVRRLRARQYDLCIDFQGLLKTALISALSGARMRVGFPKELVRERPAHLFYQCTPEPPSTQVHVVALTQLLAQSVGAPAVSPRLDFLAQREDDVFVQHLLEAKKIEGFAVINPGGGWPTKRWEPRRYGRLAARIQAELGLAVVVTTGPGEEILFVELAKHCGSSSVHHFQLPFLQLIPLLRRARLLIGGDTGPFHLACALGIPVVGIFGPTDPVRNGPWTDGEESVFRILACSFCNGRRCPTQNECMDLTVEEVFQAVVRRLARNS